MSEQERELHTPLLRMLHILGACDEAMKWVADHADSSLPELWQDCDRADWMVWLALRMAGKDGWVNSSQVEHIMWDVVRDVKGEKAPAKTGCKHYKTDRHPCKNWSECNRRARIRSQQGAPEPAVRLKKFKPPTNLHATHINAVYERATVNERVMMVEFVRMRLRPGPIPEEFLNDPEE